jgi:hypothetical protein
MTQNAQGNIVLMTIVHAYVSTAGLLHNRNNFEVVQYI